MVDRPEQPRGTVPLNSFLADFRSPVTDQELRENYGLSARAFVSLIKALLGRNLITPEDLAWRREMAVERDLAKESQFLSGLFMCPNCSHPSPVPFEVCPACGAKVSDFNQTQDSIDLVSPSGGHAYVGDSQCVDPPSKTEVPPVSRRAGRLDPVRNTQGVAPHEEPVPGDEPSEERAGEEKRLKKEPSALESVRSLLSRLKKK